MTSPAEHPGRSDLIETEAVQWLIARDEPQTWTADDQKRFEEWLELSPANQTAFWRVEASWSWTELIVDARRLDFGIDRSAPRSRSRTAMARAAAGLGFFVALGVGGGWYFRQPELQTFSTPVGGHKVITLLDGSQIELNTDTVIQIGTGESQRTVKLVRGEAFFQVHHDANHVFTVAAAGHRVTDLGTKFVMQTRGSNLEVSLLEGRASLEAESAVNGEPLILKPGDVAVATGHAVTLETKPPRKMSESLAWRKGLLIFDDTSLADAATEFNRYNAEKIVVEGLSKKKLKLNGAIRVNDREEFARMARNLFGLRVEEHNTETVIRQ